MVKTVLVTGAGGFIGNHLSRGLLNRGDKVIGLDAMIPYYDIRIKEKRIKKLKEDFPDTEKYVFYEGNINDEEMLDEILSRHKPDTIVHLAAQAGVRYCEQHKEEAQKNNINATKLLLNKCREEGTSIKHFVFASSSSIYGLHERPWGEELEPKPKGVYGNSKKTGEIMCKELYNDCKEKEEKDMSIACLRFFTVYGPTGRPDMAPAKFLNFIHRGQQLTVYGDGSAIRDFTYIDDIIQGIVLTIDNPKPFEIYNLGKGAEDPNSVLDLIKSLEVGLNKKAIIEFGEIRAGDVPATQADITKAKSLLNYQPIYFLEEGIRKTVDWFFDQHFAKRIVLFLSSSSSFSLQSNSDNEFLSIDHNNFLNECCSNVEFVFHHNTESNDVTLFDVVNNTVLIEYSLDSNNQSSSINHFIQDFLSNENKCSFFEIEEPSDFFICFLNANDIFTANYFTNVVSSISKHGSEVIFSDYYKKENDISSLAPPSVDDIKSFFSSIDNDNDNQNNNNNNNINEYFDNLSSNVVFRLDSIINSVVKNNNSFGNNSNDNFIQNLTKNIIQGGNIRISNC